MLSAVGLVPEIDTTVASQSNYTKVFASGGRYSFQNVCGEMIEVVPDHPPFISNLLWGAFLMSLIV